MEIIMGIVISRSNRARKNREGFIIVITVSFENVLLDSVIELHEIPKTPSLLVIMAATFVFSCFLRHFLTSGGATSGLCT